MKYMPSRMSLFDSMFDEGLSNSFFSHNDLMKTDIHEKDGKYTLDIEMPGFKKEDITISLFNGNLTITGNHSSNNEEKDSKGNIVRQERYSGQCSRSFYVGEAIKEDDIVAHYENGELSLEIPSVEKKEAESKKLISIQ